MRSIGTLACTLIVLGMGTTGGTAQTASVQPDAPLIDDTPLPTLPGLDLPWPDPDQAPDNSALTTEADPSAPIVAPVVNDVRYRVVLEGVDGEGLGSMPDQFRQFSALYQYEAEGANAAQIDRRVDEDLRLLERLLESRGYYAAEVRSEIRPPAGAETRLGVILIATPGPRFTFSQVTLTGIDPADEAAVRARLGIKVGDPVDAARVKAADTAFRLSLPAAGYAFAEISEPDIVVDHDTNSAALTLGVKTGPDSVFGDIRVEGRRLFSPAHIDLIARWDKGDRYDAGLLDDLRRALIATGLVASVDLKPVASGMTAAGKAEVDIAVRLERAPVRTIAGTLGYGTGEGYRAEVSWQHRNLLPPEGAVTFRGVLGTQEQLIGADLKRSNWRERDQVLFVRLAAQHQSRNAYDARTIGAGAAIERQTNIIWQKTWTYSLGAELLASSERDIDVNRDVSRRRTFFIAALPGRLAYDGSDDLLDPHRGFRLSGTVSPEASLQGGAFTYARMQVDASAYLPLGSEKYVLAGRVRAGSILGAARERIAPSRRFYAGGGGSVRGFGYQRLGPVDANNDPIGGRSLAEAAIEARIRFGNFGVVPFLDAGQLYSTTYPTFSDMRFGAGIGVRYHSSFGPMRVDIGTPLDRKPGESRVAVYVSLGQAF